MEFLIRTTMLLMVAMLVRGMFASPRARTRILTVTWLSVYAALGTELLGFEAWQISIQQESVTSPAAHGPGPQPTNTVEIIAAAYLAVVLLLLWRWFNRLRMARLLVHESSKQIPSIWERARDGISSRVPVLVHPKIRVPVTLGWIRPVILVPLRHDFDDVGATHALRHEYAHVRRRDWLLIQFSEFSRCWFWFQPLVWPLHPWLLRDIELAADYEAIARGANPQSYARTLAHAAIVGTQPTAIGFGSRKADVIHRVQQCMAWRPRTAFPTILGPMLVAIAAVMFATTGIERTVAVVALETSDSGDANRSLLLIQPKADLIETRYEEAAPDTVEDASTEKDFAGLKSAPPTPAHPQRDDPGDPVHLALTQPPPTLTTEQILAMAKTEAARESAHSPATLGLGNKPARLSIQPELHQSLPRLPGDSLSGAPFAAGFDVAEAEQQRRKEERLTTVLAAALATTGTPSYAQPVSVSNSGLISTQ